MVTVLRRNVKKRLKSFPVALMWKSRRCRTVWISYKPDGQRAEGDREREQEKRGRGMRAGEGKGKGVGEEVGTRPS